MKSIPSSPKVSVIMCFLNTEPYLAEAIESVLQQTCRLWELILIDDGSTDNSTTIARDYAERHADHIRYFEHPHHVNRGLSASRNLGLAHSRGEFIAFLDADDVWLPGMLAAQLHLIQEHHVALICEASEYWYDWTDKSHQNEIVPVGSRQNQVFSPPQLLIDLYPLGPGAAPCVCGILARKAVIEKHGGFEDSFTGMYEDQAFLIKFYLHEEIFISAGCHNRYRQRQDSLVQSSMSSGSYAQHRHHFLLWLHRYLATTPAQADRVLPYLAKALLPYQPTLFYFATSVVPKRLHRLWQGLRLRLLGRH
ncbi:glycosyltransferase family 2 protein [Hymenobacter sp. BT188]|uniref:glycosyltransferase family 2 protein n=1 Tax=Hymenobacter sp. BT188 TaxID=2763504 RepID=UPI0016510F10|nr:glycosyltransferase family A protein [Hymenobacter sp. BT188]MBC6609122.1 glycosyltransferase family 2 protein [Hymenobacter sp. BT188]